MGTIHEPGLEQALTKSLLVEVVLGNWKEALHVEAMFERPRVVPPNPCTCRGCQHFHAQKTQARKKLGEMSTGELIRLLQVQRVVEEED